MTIDTAYNQLCVIPPDDTTPNIGFIALSIQGAIQKKKFIGHLKPPNKQGCRVYQGSIDTYGYGRFYLTVNTKGPQSTGKPRGRYVKAHRFSHELFVGPILKGMLVCHTCDNPPCCEPTHLFLGTFSDNAKDRHQKGRTSPNWRSSTTKLTEEEVRHIRHWKERGGTRNEIATKFDIDPSTVDQITKRKTWKYVS